MTVSGIVSMVGMLLLVHALATATQYHSISDSDVLHPIIVAECILGFVFAVFGYMHKVNRFEPIARKKLQTTKTYESFFHNQQFAVFNHRGSVCDSLIKEKKSSMEDSSLYHNTTQI